MARLLGYAEDLSESTSTGSTVTKASVTADLVNGTTYALFWSYQAGSDDTTSIGRARCMDATGAASRGLNQCRARDTTDYAWAGNVSIYTAAATASRTFEVDFIRTSGTGTVKIKNVRLLVLELTADDAFGATVGNQTTTSTSFSDATSAAFTPSSTGDYLFIASGAITNGNTEIELQTPGGTSVNTITTAIPYSGVYQPWSVVWREDGLTAVSQTAHLRWRSTSGATQNMQAACIVALRLDRFGNVQNTQDDTGDGGTDTAYTATESLSATNLAADQRDTIILASVSVANNSTADSSYIEFRDGGTQIVEGVHEAASASLRTSAGLIGYKPTSASSSITFDLRRKSESTNTTTVEFASIALLELPVEGSATLTESADSLSGVGSIFAEATATITAANDSVSATGALLIQGVASITGANDSLTGAGELDIAGVGSAAEADDSLSATGDLPIFGTAYLTEADDSISAAAMLYLMGGVDLYEDDDSVTANDFVPRGRVDLYEDDDYLRFHGGISAEWMQEQATKGDIPNWNHCARCHKEMRPNQMLQQNRRVGSTVVWTGIYVCPDCWDPIHPQDRWPRNTGGDPRPVPNARPFRGG